MSDELRWEVVSGVLKSCLLAKQDYRSMQVNGNSGLPLNLQNQGPFGCIFSGHKYHLVFSAAYEFQVDLMRPVGHPALCSWNSVPVECL